MGCGSSVPIASSLGQKKPTSSNNRLPPIRRDESTPPEKEINLEPLTLVCLDEHFLAYRKQLQSIIDDFHCFARLEQCEEFLTDPAQQSASIFLLLSNKSFFDVLSRAQHLPQISSVYLLDEQQRTRADSQWAKRYSKVKGVYSDHQSLLDQLSSDVPLALNLNDFIPITVYNRLDAIQSQGTSTDHLRFLFYQLFLQHYCLNCSSPLTRTDLIESLGSYYSSNRRQAKLLEQFNEEYDPSADVTHWWTEGSFVRRVLTRALTELNMSMLFNARFFIRDLFKSMINQGSATGNKTNGYGRSRATNNEQIFYRGQALAKENFFKIKSNIGEILSLNDFFLANRTRQGSLKLLCDQVPKSDLVYRVLFELKVPSDYSLQKQRPFVHLHSARRVIDEDDDLFSTLFCAGSIFRIQNAVFDMNHDSWIVQLTLYDEHVNEDFSPMFNFLHQSKQSPTVLANLLRQISPASAEQFYKHVLKENSSHSKVECYRGLGLCSYSRNDYDQALHYFHQALHCKSEQKVFHSSLHHDLGLVYAQQRESDQALKHFHQALEGCALPLHRACVHHNIALVYSQQGEHQEELEHYEEALQIRSKQLPNQHLQLASLQNNIGIAYADLQQYDRALKNLRTALETRLKLLPDSHIEVARSYANIGTVYGKTKEYRMALEYFNKAHLLFEKQTLLPEGDLEQLDRNIKIINDKIRRKTY